MCVCARAHVRARARVCVCECMYTHIDIYLDIFDTHYDESVYAIKIKFSKKCIFIYLSYSTRVLKKNVVVLFCILNFMSRSRSIFVFN